MAAVDGDGAAGGGPPCALTVGGLRDVGAGPDPLGGGVEAEGVAAPFGVEDVEVGGCEGGEGREGEKGGAQHPDDAKQLRYFDCS